MCCLSGEPLDEDERNKHTSKSHDENGQRKGTGRYMPDGTRTNTFQTGMCGAWYADCPTSCCWFMCQFFPLTMGCTQFALRRKLIDGKMEDYRCFQGQFYLCCGMIGADKCCETSCPTLCLCCEAHCCNGLAVSASRMVMMDQYELMADPCDNRLIRFSNFMQILSCVCHVLAMIDGNFRTLADIIDLIADLVYHTVSGCMTAQVAMEIDYQQKEGKFPFNVPKQIGEVAGPAQAYPVGGPGGRTAALANGNPIQENRGNYNGGSQGKY